MNIKNLKRIMRLWQLSLETRKKLAELKAVYEKEEKVHSAAVERFKNNLEQRILKERLYRYHIRMVGFYFKKRMMIKHLLKKKGMKIPR